MLKVLAKTKNTLLLPFGSSTLIDYIKLWLTNFLDLFFITLLDRIGGFRLACESAGGQCAFTSEEDRYSRQTYIENFGYMPHGDICKINEKDIPCYVECPLLRYHIKSRTMEYYSVCFTSTDSIILRA